MTNARNLRHAQMLAGIAAQVAATYRDSEPSPDRGTPTFPLASTTSHDPSWDFVIPERYQG